MGTKQRLLSNDFIHDLTSIVGILRPLLRRVHEDDTLDMHIRAEALNVYYRGVSVLKVNRKSKGLYEFFFDPKYFEDGQLGSGGSPRRGLGGSKTIKTHEDCEQWVASLPLLKDSMDRWLTLVKSAREREAQQLFVRENTWDEAGARATDYFVLDVEYADGVGRADVVAMRWPSTRADRVGTGPHRLALVELKFGDGAIGGTSGLKKHVADAAKLAAQPTLARLCDEMEAVYHVKHRLRLINNGRPDQGSLDRSGLDLIFVLANHDPAKTALSTEIRAIMAMDPSKKPANLNIFVARANAFGYGLFEDRLMPLTEFAVLLEADAVRHAVARRRPVSA